VANTKVDGTLALHRTFASPNLAFFLSLSSVSGIIGTSAQASYNAGNAVQDALAHQEQQKSGKTRFLTINFGWIEDAVFTVNDKTRQSALRRAGFSLIRAEELMRFFDRILGAATDPSASFSQAIIGFDVESLASATAHNSTIHSALFSQVRDTRRTTSTKEGVGAEALPVSGQTFEQVIAAGNAEAVADFISRAVTEQLAKLISVDAGSIDARRGSLLALGLDSLVAVELRNWVMRQFDAPLQSSEILANQTVQALAEKVAARSKKVVRVAA
jgi:acyl carrier protein